MHIIYFVFMMTVLDTISVGLMFFFFLERRYFDKIWIEYFIRSIFVCVCVWFRFARSLSFLWILFLYFLNLYGGNCHTIW